MTDKSVPQQGRDALGLQNLTPTITVHLDAVALLFLTMVAISSRSASDTPRRWRVRRQSSEVKRSRLEFPFQTCTALPVLLRAPSGFSADLQNSRGPKSIAAVPCLSSVPAWRFEEVSAAQLKMSSMDSVTCKFLDNIRVHRFRIGYIQFAFGNRAVVLLGEAAPVER